MISQQDLVSTFYEAFGRKDYQAMNACYSDDIVFSDPVFGVLQGEEVKAMWEMLCKRATDLKVTYNNIRLLDDEYSTCDWKASYTFTSTGNHVVNNVVAHMRIREGRITEHSDAFKVSSWAAQALGWKGKLLGWTGFMKRKIRNNALKSLKQFMERKVLST